MNFTLKIWRQKDAKAKGAFETYKVENILPDTSFLDAGYSEQQPDPRGQGARGVRPRPPRGYLRHVLAATDGRAHGPGDGATTRQIYMRRFKDGATIVIEPWRSAAFP